MVMEERNDSCDSLVIQNAGFTIVRSAVRLYLGGHGCFFSFSFVSEISGLGLHALCRLKLEFVIALSDEEVISPAIVVSQFTLYLTLRNTRCVILLFFCVFFFVIEKHQNGIQKSDLLSYTR